MWKVIDREHWTWNLRYPMWQWSNHIWERWQHSAHIQHLHYAKRQPAWVSHEGQRTTTWAANLMTYTPWQRMMSKVLTWTTLEDKHATRTKSIYAAAPTAIWTLALCQKWNALGGHVVTTWPLIVEVTPVKTTSQRASNWWQMEAPHTDTLLTANRWITYPIQRIEGMSMHAGWGQ